MVLYSDLKNWENGNISDIDRAGLISIARYFEAHAEDKDPKDEIEYDRQRDEDYTGVPDDTPTATQEQTDEYLSSLQEDRAIAAQERAIHIGEHGGALDE